MKTKNTLQRIKEYLEIEGITIRSFEQSVGMSNGSFASQLRNNKTIGVDKLENILQVYSKLNPDWLLTGNEPMLRAHEDIPPTPAHISILLQEVERLKEEVKDLKKKEMMLLDMNKALVDRALSSGSDAEACPFCVAVSKSGYGKCTDLSAAEFLAAISA